VHTWRRFVIGAETATLIRGVEGAAGKACRALVELGAYRCSPDPTIRAAYAAVHDLIGDLGSLRMQIEALGQRSAPSDDRASAGLVPPVRDPGSS
jgi:hypothetical protein